MPTKIPNLTKEGRCKECKKWIAITDGKSWVPKHTKKSGGSGDCKGTKHNATEYKYIVKTAGEAKAVKDFIENYDGSYLVQQDHSEGCNDGEDCKQIILLITEALETYRLEHP